MQKEEVLQRVIVAQFVHKELVEKAKSIMKGNASKESSLPIDINECEFGKWFYADGQKLGALSNIPQSCMQNIAKLHKSVHEIYVSIFVVYFPDLAKTGLFSKFFGEKRKALSTEEEEYVVAQFRVLESTSSELLDELSRLERRLEAVSQEKIASLSAY